MRLIGMLDSPYVRRSAIALHALGLPFVHEPVSVFVDYERFRAQNPVVKAPTLVCEDGVVLMDSSLIIEYAQTLAPHQQLWPASAAARRLAFRMVGLGLAACDKAVQSIYERSLRPADKQYEPWLARVESQIRAAVQGLEAEARANPELAEPTATVAGITAAVTWYFLQAMLPNLIATAEHPTLSALSAAAERTEPFARYAHRGPGVQPL